LFFILLTLIYILLSGCAPVTSKGLRDEAARNLTFLEVSINPEAYKGEVVIWGGQIVRVRNQEKGTGVIEVLQKPLDLQEAPRETDPAGGRFLILVKEALDPHVYRRGREITVAGEILGEKTGLLGKMEYRYPLILSKQIYLWPMPPQYYEPPPYYPSYPWNSRNPYDLYDPWELEDETGPKYPF